MDKLVKRFEEVLHESKDIFRGSYTADYLTIDRARVKCAEEVKKLAIGFSKYIVNCKDLDGNIIGNNNHFIDNFGDKLFDKFLEEYYE